MGAFRAAVVGKIHPGKRGRRGKQARVIVQTWKDDEYCTVALSEAIIGPVRGKQTGRTEWSMQSSADPVPSRPGSPAPCPPTGQPSPLPRSAPHQVRWRTDARRVDAPPPGLCVGPRYRCRASPHTLVEARVRLVCQPVVVLHHVDAPLGEVVRHGGELCGGGPHGL
jgi:hypothetical protein